MSVLLIAFHNCSPINSKSVDVGTSLVDLPAQEEIIAGKYSLKYALQKGLVDIYHNPWVVRPIDDTIQNLELIAPGAVLELGFLYGGVSQEFLNRIAGIADQIHLKQPHTLLGARFQEHLDIVNYPLRTIACGKSANTLTYDHRLMVSDQYSGVYYWLDPTKNETQKYLICLGKSFIDAGFTMIGITNAYGIASRRGNIAETMAAFRAVQLELDNYAKEIGSVIYWGGEVVTTEDFKTDYAFEPMRVFDLNSWGEGFRNKIYRPGVGVGYSFVLSEAIVVERKSHLKKSAQIIFYVDNYDGENDDLARFMELDAINRRYMISMSKFIAKKEGAFVSWPLSHCEGCIQPSRIVDSCNLIPNSNLSGYNAFACGDFPAIIESHKIFK